MHFVYKKNIEFKISSVEISNLFLFWLAIFLFSGITVVALIVVFSGYFGEER